MGYGYPAALGVKVALPDKQVIDIDGDGSFLMNIQELATAHVEKIAAKAIILNNQHLGMVVQWEDNFYEGNRGHTYLGDPEHRAGNLSRLRARVQFVRREMRARDVQKRFARRHPAHARCRRTLRPRCGGALQHARHPVHSRRQNRGGHDLEGVSPVIVGRISRHSRLVSGQTVSGSLAILHFAKEVGAWFARNGSSR